MYVRKYISLNRITLLSTLSSRKFFFEGWPSISLIIAVPYSEEERGASISELALQVEQCSLPLWNPSTGITFSRLKARNTKANFLLHFSLELRVSWDQVTGMSFHFHSCSNTPKQSHSCYTVHWYSAIMQGRGRQEYELRKRVSGELMAEWAIGSEAELKNLPARSDQLPLRPLKKNLKRELPCQVKFVLLKKPPWAFNEKLFWLFFLLPSPNSDNLTCNNLNNLTSFSSWPGLSFQLLASTNLLSLMCLGL